MLRKCVVTVHAKPIAPRIVSADRPIGDENGKGARRVGLANASENENENSSLEMRSEDASDA